MVYGSHKTPVFCCQIDLENWAQVHVKRLLSFDKKLRTILLRLLNLFALLNCVVSTIYGAEIDDGKWNDVMKI